jgi:hypothetical protein
MSAPIGLGLLFSLLISPLDPQGVRDLALQVGETWRTAAPVAAEIVCDDPAIVQPGRSRGMASFTGLREGSTLCAVRYVSGAPQEAYRITVNR